MKWTIIWVNRALAMLARIYLRAQESGKETEELIEAMARIERTLARDPLKQGESREQDERWLSEDPLNIDFEVHEEERTVIVLAVRVSSRWLDS